MANFYTLGPADIYLRFRNGQSPEAVFFGNTITGAEITPKHYYNDIYSDLSGRNIPIGRLDDGVEHDVLMTVNRIDYTAYKRLQAFAQGAASAGTESRIIRGRFHTGISDVEVIFVYTFPAVGGVALPADAPIGRRYYSCTYRTGLESRKGSRVEEATLLFTASPLFDRTTRGFNLYTEVAANVTAGLPVAD